METIFDCLKNGALILDVMLQELMEMLFWLSREVYEGNRRQNGRYHKGTFNL